MIATGDLFDAWEISALLASRVLELLDGTGHPIGPVLVDPSRRRWTFLTEPRYEETTVDVPADGSARYHGRGGFVLAPPSRIGTERLRWWRPPPARAPRLPHWGPVVEAIHAAGVSTPVGRPVERTRGVISVSCLHGLPRKGMGRP